MFQCIKKIWTLFTLWIAEAVDMNNGSYTPDQGSPGLTRKGEKVAWEGQPMQVYKMSAELGTRLFSLCVSAF